MSKLGIIILITIIYNLMLLTLNIRYKSINWILNICVPVFVCLAHNYFILQYSNLQ